jgi:ribulose 1,5-bisphosphate synthetase/thiazole synthase
MGTKHSKPNKMSAQHTIDATGGDAEVAYFALG